MNALQLFLRTCLALLLPALLGFALNAYAASPNSEFLAATGQMRELDQAFAAYLSGEARASFASIDTTCYNQCINRGLDGTTCGRRCGGDDHNGNGSRFQCYQSCQSRGSDNDTCARRCP